VAELLFCFALKPGGLSICLDTNGNKNQEIIFKNNKPFTHLLGFDRNGNKDYFSDLKNGNGIIYLRDYRTINNNTVCIKL